MSLLPWDGDLDEWETLLARAVAGKALLGEVQLQDQELRWVGQRLGERLRSGWSAHRLWRRYPTCAACFSVAVFAQEYDSGSYWPQMEELLGDLDVQTQNEWREEFPRYLLEQGLPTFDHVKGNEYLRRVRIHALISADGARRVFAHVVKPAVERGLHEGGWSAADILEELGVRYPTLHKPETDFLKYGGHIADDLLGRCMTLYRVALEGGETDGLDLPPWVVREFEEWWGSSPEGGPCPPPPSHLPAPDLTLRLALDQECVLLVVSALPPAWKSEVTLELQAEQAEERSWHALLNHKVETDPFARPTEAVLEVAIPQPSRKYRACWRHVDGDSDTCEIVQGLRGTEVPWIAFASEDACALIQQKCLPRRKCWLVCPTDARLRGLRRGDQELTDVEVLEEFRLDNWHHMAARLVDPSDLCHLALARGPETERIEVDLTPRLVLVDRVPGATINGRPVCASVPRLDCAGDAAGVMVEVEALTATGGLRRFWSVTADGLGRDLHGKAGEFRLRVGRRRLGCRGEPVEFALLPGLQVSFEPRLVLPDHEGPIRCQVHCPPSLTVRPNTSLAETGVSGLDPLTAKQDARRLEFVVVHKSEDGSPQEFALSVVVPRLLVGAEDESSVELRSLLPAPVVLTKQQFQRAARINLLMVLQPESPTWQVDLWARPAGWHLRRPSRPTASPRLSFDLAGWRDAVLDMRQPQELRADLYLGDNRLIRDVLVGHLISACQLEKLRAEIHRGAGRGCTLHYQFNPAGPASSLRATHASYPWLRPYEIRLNPNMNKGTISIEHIPPGEYLVEPVEGCHEATDILPNTDRGRRIALAGEREPATGYEAVLRNVALIWDDAWQWEDGKGWRLNADRAARAEAAMHSKAGQLTLELSRNVRKLTADDLRKTVVLMLFWGQKAIGCQDYTAVQYWQQAVMLMVRLLKAKRNPPNLLQELQDQLRNLAQQAAPQTRELCRRLQGALLQAYQRA